MLDKKDIEVIKDLLQPLEKDIKEVKQNQTKHSVLLEGLKHNVNTLVEGQQAQKEQIDRQFKELRHDIKNDSTLIKSALTDVSSNVKDMKDGYSDLRSATAQNSFDIQILRNKANK